MVTGVSLKYLSSVQETMFSDVDVSFIEVPVQHIFEYDLLLLSN